MPSSISSHVATGDVERARSAPPVIRYAEIVARQVFIGGLVEVTHDHAAGGVELFSSMLSFESGDVGRVLVQVVDEDRQRLGVARGSVHRHQ